MLPVVVTPTVFPLSACSYSCRPFASSRRPIQGLSISPDNYDGRSLLKFP